MTSQGLIIAILFLAALGIATGRSRHARFDCPQPYGNFPHPIFCNLYYQCRSGDAYLFECPYDWLFDSKLALCDLPERVDCGELIIPGTKPPLVTSTSRPEETTTDDWHHHTTESTTLPTTEEVTTEKATTTDRPTTPGEFVCPAEDGNYPNPLDCGSYFACVAGNAYPQDCPPGTEFNPNTQGCEFPGDFCEDRRQKVFKVKKVAKKPSPMPTPQVGKKLPVSHIPSLAQKQKKPASHIPSLAQKQKKPAAPAVQQMKYRPTIFSPLPARKTSSNSRLLQRRIRF